MQRTPNPEMAKNARVLRRKMTRQEKRLWYDFLRKYPVHFYRQRAIGKYVADFYCPRAALVIELDGSQHYYPEGVARDSVRTDFLEKNGLSVLRIQNIDVDSNFEGVCLYIDRIIKSLVVVNDL